MPRFSVVIPIFNSSNFLGECLDSLLSQSFADFELILVDDGSSDGSATILDEYAKKDNRCRVFHKSNAGVSSARNFGLDVAQGEYICFVDADDIVLPQYLELLYWAMYDGADSSMGGFEVLKDDTIRISVIPETKRTESLEENLAEFYSFEKPQWQHYLWNRMFMTSVIRKHNLRFREDIYYKEDGLFVVQYLCASNGKVGCVDQVVYRYRTNPMSAMGQVDNHYNPRHITNLIAHKLLIEELRKKEVSSVILEKAITQAKSSANWISKCMYKYNNSMKMIQVEVLMLRILGFSEYIKWRRIKVKSIWR